VGEFAGNLGKAWEPVNDLRERIKTRNVKEHKVQLCI
jgi:hypothetical protein